MDTRRRVAIIGDGGWGTTLGLVLSRKGFGVTVWGAFPEYVEVMKYRRENVKFLPGVKIPEEIKITSLMDEALEGKDLVVLAVPSQFMRGVLGRLKMHELSGKSFLSVTKGIENGTLKRMSEVVRDVLGRVRLAVLSGPTIALEVANGLPTTAVVSSDEAAFAKETQEVLMTGRFRIYASSDTVGLELGGSLKNVMAIGCGILDGLKARGKASVGDNTKAAYITEAVQEMGRLIRASGCQAETVNGLAGLGDLFATGTSAESRNRAFGQKLGEGKTPRKAIAEIPTVVEGVEASTSAYELAGKVGGRYPIIDAVWKVVHRGRDPRLVVRAMGSLGHHP